MGWIGRGLFVTLAMLSFRQTAEAQAPRPVPPLAPVPDSSARRAKPDGNLTPSGWEVTADPLATHPGARYNFWCPPAGRLGPVWGDQVYSSDSSVCTAAVHAGNLSILAGGNAVIEMRPGQASYAASRRNGVTTWSRGAWKASFVLVSPP